MLSKWNANHELQWTKQWGSAGNEFVADLARDADGNLFVTGWTSGNLQGGNAGTFAKVGSPSITMQVANLPLLGQTVSIQVTGASINVPTSCGLGFGSANISTAFTIGDGSGAAILAQGTDTWTCVPFQLINF